MGLVLSVDVGSSTTRVAAVDLEGNRRVTVVGADNAPFVHGTDARAAEALWEAVATTVHRVVEQVGQPMAVGVSAFLGSVLLDADARPVMPVLSWADRRATHQSQVLQQRLEPSDLAATGRGASPELTAPKLLWVRQEAPEAFDRVATVVSVKDFIVARLTGALVTDCTHASYTLLYDVHRREWSEKLLDITGLRRGVLPPVRNGADAAGEVNRAAAHRTGLRPGIPVAVGGPDGAVGALGAGTCEAGATANIAGTTDVVVHLLDRPVEEVGGEAVLNAHVLEGLWSIGGPTGLTGGTISWLGKLLGSENYRYPESTRVPSGTDTPEELAGANAPIPSHVRVSPGLAGERFPMWDPDATGAIAGLRPHHTRDDIMQAAHEAVTFTVREGLEAVHRAVGPIKQVVLAGGLAQRRTLCQLRADAWGLPTVVVADHEATLIGTAALASVAGSHHGSVKEAIATMVSHPARFDPDPDRGRALDAAYTAWQDEFRRKRRLADSRRHP